MSGSGVSDAAYAGRAGAAALVVTDAAGVAGAEDAVSAAVEPLPLLPARMMPGTSRPGGRS